MLALGAHDVMFLEEKLFGCHRVLPKNLIPKVLHPWRAKKFSEFEKSGITKNNQGTL